MAVVAWFLGAVIGHDLLLMPLYSIADRSAMAAVRRREPQLPATPWINYMRVPAALSGLLLLVWFPLILRLQSPYHASTTLSADPYVWHWLTTISPPGCGPTCASTGGRPTIGRRSSKNVLAADILVLAGPIWLGDNSSVMKKVQSGSTAARTSSTTPGSTSTTGGSAVV